ncbi:MAG: DUF2378 family protein [Deltaproteobacteria bacterium]|nr:DUF2378 family protein [Deltaproteobacteria bacterium]
MERFLWVALAGWFGFGLQHIVSGHFRATVIHLSAGMLSTLLLIVLRVNPRVSAARLTHMGLAVTALAMGADAMISGGMEAAGLPWLTLLPLVASYALSRRAALSWLAGATAVAVGVGIVSSMWPVAPEYQEAGALRIQSIIALAFAGFVLASAGRRAFDAELARASELAERVKNQAQAADKAKEQAINLARLKDGLIANTSHELRTPLNGILGTLTLLEISELDDRQRDLVDNAKASAEHLAALLADILDLSAMQAGALRLAPASIDLREVLEDVLDVVAARAAERGVDLSLDLPKHAPLVMLDPVRVRQIVLNVVGNAVKFTEQGEVAVRLRYEEKETDVAIEIRVRDTGPGMSEVQRAKLFIPFEQGDASYTRRVEGSGLGLAVSVRLAKALGGAIDVESEVGLGSVFTIRITVPRGGPGTTAPPYEGLVVVVVEPRETVRRGIKTTLECLGCSVLEAEDARTARARFEESLVDAVVLGPAISGEYAEAVATKLGAPANVRVIALLIPLRGARAGSAGSVRMVLAPARRKRLAAALARQVTKDPPRKAPEQSSKLRVLVVDDAAVNRLVSTGLVEALGHHAEGVASGAEALELLTRKSFDAVLLDLAMPGMSGFELLSRIRVQKPGDDCPFLVVSSASVDAATRQQVRAARADEFLPKPVRIEALEQLLAAVSGRATGVTPSAARPARAVSSASLDLEIFGELAEIFTIHAELRLTCEAFLRSLDELVAWLASSASNEPLELRHRAHTVRGSSGTIGATRLAQLAGEVEDAIVTDRALHALSLRASLADEARSAARAVRRQLDPAAPDLDQPIDLETELLAIPEDANARGLFFLHVLDQIPKELAGSPQLSARLRDARVGAGPYFALATYPLRDLIRLMAVVASFRNPPVAMPRGIHALAMGFFDAFAGSLAGRQLFGVLGIDLEAFVEHAARVHNSALSIGTLELSRLDEHTLSVAARDVPAALVSFELGFIEGALLRLGVANHATVLRVTKSGFVLEFSW